MNTRGRGLAFADTKIRNSLIAAALLGLCACRPTKKEPTPPNPTTTSRPDEDPADGGMDHDFTLKNKTGQAYSYESDDSPLHVTLSAESKSLAAECKNENICHFKYDGKYHILYLDAQLDKAETRRFMLTLRWATTTDPDFKFDPAPYRTAPDDATKTTTFEFDLPPTGEAPEYKLKEDAPAYRLTVKVQLKP